MTSKPNQHAKILSKMGASKGGKTRASVLTPEERKEIARKAVRTRWAKEKSVPIEKIGGKPIPKKPLKATHQGEVRIGNISIPCAVLGNRERVISVRGFSLALGVKGGGAYWKLKRESDNPELLPEFVSAKYLEPYITDELRETIKNTITYTSLKGQEAAGIKATVIPRICDVWLRALSGGGLDTKQQKVAKTAHVLLSAFADVGITALVDEATGFQKEKDEYSRILEKYIAKELQQWIKTFGEDYYFQIYRLKGLDWDRFATDKKNHPWMVANITNRIVYEKLPVGVLEELKSLNPADKKGVRKHRHFQHLTPNAGYVHLLKHLGAIVNIMERYKNGEWEKALQEIDVRFRSHQDPYQLTLDFKRVKRNIFAEPAGLS